MSLERIDRYVSEIEAVKYYVQAKEERDKARLENISLQQEIGNLKQRIFELESIKNTTDGKTVAEAERIILAGKENEIKLGANERFLSLKESWQRKEKPD